MAKGKTGNLPGIDDHKIIPELSKAGEEYEEVKMARVKLSAKEAEKYETLKGLMHKHKKRRYQDDDLIVWIEDAEEKVKTKREKEPPKKAVNQ